VLIIKRFNEFRLNVGEYFLISFTKGKYFPSVSPIGYTLRNPLSVIRFNKGCHGSSGRFWVLDIRPQLDPVIKALV